MTTDTRPTPEEVRAMADTLVAGPPSSFKKCPRCGERWTKLWEDESCVDCSTTDPPPRNQVLEALGAPANLSGERFDPKRSQPVAAALEKLDGWRRRPRDPWSVTLIGETGTGKSMLAVELYWRWYQWRFRRTMPTEVPNYGYFVRARRVADAAFNREPPAPGRPSDIDRWTRCPFLILDEFGVGHSGGATDPIVDLLCQRYDRDLATIVTTNLPGMADSSDGRPGLESVSPQLADRLRSGVLIPMRGASLRQRGEVGR